ncbi:hypothetical protein SAMN05660461_4333 [Chitinophaga ginsengisegetis]|uniref:Uncharacterized protein n=1 Tax=Chitinophaga ginsengisegetis TaxID=393003 RepID=A0A1T5P774_9BACT|nr:hypothetical protein SAMN05660461_4333 [Chitinophaga ginsengisegetis]
MGTLNNGRYIQGISKQWSANILLIDALALPTQIRPGKSNPSLQEADQPFHRMD